MSQTLDEIYIANPSASMVSTDLLYLVHSPYTSGQDSAITFADFLPSIFPTTVVITASATMVSNTRYIANRAGLVTLTLPVASNVGDAISIVGMGTGGWKIAQAVSQQMFVSPDATTSGTGGSIASTGQYDSIRLVCITANTLWTAEGGPQSAGLTIV